MLDGDKNMTMESDNYSTRLSYQRKEQNNIVERSRDLN